MLATGSVIQLLIDPFCLLKFVLPKLLNFEDLSDLSEMDSDLLGTCFNTMVVHIHQSGCVNSVLAEHA